MRAFRRACVRNEKKPSNRRIPSDSIRDRAGFRARVRIIVLYVLLYDCRAINNGSGRLSRR
jgi:hypothetical protein